MRIKARYGIGAAVVVLVVACGARTPLEVDEFEPIIVVHGGGAGAPGEGDGGAGAAGKPKDGGKDAPLDSPKDSPPDVAKDVAVDTPIDAPPDAIPDMMVPDVSKIDCVDQGITYIYVVTEQQSLYAFDPMTNAFSFIGTVDCPSQMPGATPFSMAVNRKGVAYVVYSSGELFRVSTKTAQCLPTSFQPGQLGFLNFGMGFSTDEGGPAETLYVAADGNAMTGGSPVPALGTIDVNSFLLSKIADVAAGGMELTGTGDGRLFGFYQEGFGTGMTQGLPTHLVQIDKKSAAFTADVLLPMVDLGGGWAFGFWGGAFYFFTAPFPPGGGSPDHTVVTRYAPGTGMIGEIATLQGEYVVGAGVSTCAPED